MGSASFQQSLLTKGALVFRVSHGFMRFLGGCQNWPVIIIEYLRCGVNKWEKRSGYYGGAWEMGKHLRIRRGIKAKVKVIQIIILKHVRELYSFLKKGFHQKLQLEQPPEIPPSFRHCASAALAYVLRNA